MKILAAFAIASALGLQPDTDFGTIPLTPTQEAMCRAGGGCVVITVQDLRAAVGEACGRNGNTVSRNRKET